MRRFSARDRIKSPRHRSHRSLSPMASSREVLDSSLDHEMRAAGFDVNDSFDSSEGVGFSDTNLDVLVLDSDPSFDPRDKREKEVGGRDVSQNTEPSTAWEEKEQGKVEDGVSDGGDGSGRLGKGTDQAQATSSGTLEGCVVEGGADVVGAGGQELLSRLLGAGEVDKKQQPDEGDGDDVMDQSGQLSCNSDGELLAANTSEKGKKGAMLAAFGVHACVCVHVCLTCVD